MVGAELRFSAEVAQFAIFAGGASDEVGHGHRSRVAGGGVGSADGDIADVAAGEAEGGGEEVEVQVVGLRELGAEVLFPQSAAVVFFGHGEVDDGVQAAGEGFV